MYDGIKKTPISVTVFVGAVEDFSDWERLPSYAAEELKSINNPRVAAEKKAGYGLLAFAAAQVCPGFDTRDCYLGDTGKPLHPKLWFSVSHSGGLAAVAMAEVPVGVDIETTESLERVKRLEKRITHPCENYDNPLELWTLKEAVFKLEGKEKIFRPADIDTTLFFGQSIELLRGEREYLLSVAAENPIDTDFYTAPGMTKPETKNCKKCIDIIQVDHKK